MKSALTSFLAEVLRLLPTLLVTVVLVFLLYDSFVLLLVLAMFAWVVLPAAVAALWLWVRSFRRITIAARVHRVWGGLNLLLLVGLVVWWFSQPPAPERMAQHYDRHADELDQLALYTRQALDDSAYLHIEFDHGQPSLFHVQCSTDNLISHHWGDDAQAHRDSLMAVVGLSDQEYREIRSRLRRLRCIGISVQNRPSDSSAVVVDYYREAMGMYSYNLFFRPLTPEEEELFRTDLMYIPYTPHVVFQYAGGAIGPQTFSQQQKRDFLNSRKRAG